MKPVTQRGGGGGFGAECACHLICALRRLRVSRDARGSQFVPHPVRFGFGLSFPFPPRCPANPMSPPPPHPYIYTSPNPPQWKETLSGAAHPSADLSPEAQWDAVPLAAKWQIFAVIAALEVWDECGGGGQHPHYMAGRQIGKYPSFAPFRDAVHPVFDLVDPLGWNGLKKMSAEKKERGLISELNNGRLAMIGIFGFLAADKVEGSVPALTSIAIPYSGDPMVPFEGQFSYADLWGWVN